MILTTRRAANGHTLLSRRHTQAHSLNLTHPPPLPTTPMQKHGTAPLFSKVSGPIVDAYMAGASVVGASAVKPVYVVGVGAVAAGALLFTYYACGASRKTPKASRSRGKKKRNAKRKSVMAKRRSKMNRGVAVENGCAGVGLAAPGVSGSTANDSGERRESGGAPTSAQAVKAAEIPTSSVDQSQGKGEQKGSGTQPAPKEAPPVMTVSKQRVLDEMVVLF